MPQTKSIPQEGSMDDRLTQLETLNSELRQSLREFHEVQELAKIIRTTGNSQDLLEALKKVLGRVIPDPDAALFLIVQGELQAVGDPTIGLLNLAHVCDEEGIIVWAFEEARPISLPEISPQAEGSDLLIPLLAMDRGIGILLVRSSIHRESLTTQQLDLLAFAGSQAALALENQMLLDQQVESRERLQLLIDHAGDLILLLDADGRIRYANRHATLLGIDRRQLSGRLFLDFLDSQEEKDTMLQLLQSGDHDLREWNLEVKETLEVQISMSPMPISAKEEAQYLLILRDMKPLRELEHQRQQTEALRALSLAAVRMNHEINSPLTSISVSLHLFRAQLPVGENEKAMRTLDNAEDACQQIALVLRQFEEVRELKTVPYVGGAEMLAIPDKKTEEPS